MNQKYWIICFLLFLFGVGTSTGHAQSSWKWIDMLKEGSINGRIDRRSTAHFQRLPEELKNAVRKPVWELSTNSAGLYINFKTTATAIQIRYGVAGTLQFPHMPAVGVSGIDLYAQDSQTNDWFWASGKYSFKDTVTYVYGGLDSNSTKNYQLYLPLYNTVTWMEIGIPDSVSLDFVSETAKPIIVYGTSIAQGACASRPGMAWTNILHREIGVPVVNLGFSGNGRLEKPILDLIATTPAKAIVLDCLPNLGVTATRSEQQLDSLIYHAVLGIRKKQPTTPIILTEHSSGLDEHILNTDNNRNFQRPTMVLRQTFARLKQEGVAHIYLLTNQEIGLDINSTVDYVHPNDWGMLKIAKAYTRLLKDIGQ